MYSADELYARNIVPTTLMYFDVREDVVRMILEAMRSVRTETAAECRRVAQKTATFLDDAMYQAGAHDTADEIADRFSLPEED